MELNNKKIETIVFTSLARNQTEYFVSLGKKLEQNGYKVAIVCFHEPSYSHIVHSGLKAYNPHSMLKQQKTAPRAESFGIADVNSIISHETYTFKINNQAKLRTKLRTYLGVIDEIFENIEHHMPTPSILVQEFGGFISLIAAFYVARKRSIDNIFIEPSFYKGKVFFVKNSFGAINIKIDNQKNSAKEVIDYIENVKKEQAIVIPEKDTHHYRSPVKKIFDAYNYRRLYEKLVDKYIRKEAEEFNHIGEYVFRHLKMVINRHRFRKMYCLLDSVPNYIYYPLHVPNDAALTIRSPDYLDQFAFLGKLAKDIPPKYKLVIKEHPALIGAIEYKALCNLLHKNNNVKILDPRHSNYDVMKKAEMIVTVNSKSGAEALLLNKNVIVFGDAFYSQSSLIKRAGNYYQGVKYVKDILNNNSKIPFENADLINYFQSVWNNSYDGELYSNSEDQVKTMANSLTQYFYQL